MLRGTLPLRCCTSRLAHKVPTWGLPFPGGVALLVGLGHGGGMLVRSDPSSPDYGRIGDRSGVSGSGCKRVFDLGENPHWLRKMMMLEGGSCMIILILGVLFMTGRVLAERHGVHEPTPSDLHGF